jgi:hypothetical protein
MTDAGNKRSERNGRGKKYTTRNRVPEPRKIPSLLEKVEHVRNNSSIIFKNDGRQTLDFVGVNSSA